MVALTVVGCGRIERKTAFDPTTINELTAYLLANQQAPEDYVVSRFKEHDVVFLGELHRIKHDPELVQHLIPLLYQSGVYTLATEFARKQDQLLIDSLLGGVTYDESLARLIMFHQVVDWAYREYVDIFKAAWLLNYSLPDNARKFRVLGLNCSPDWSVMKSPADRDVDSLKRLVWGGCTEKDWADVILRQVSNGEKILVYCGMHHAFTEFLQPIVDDTGGFIRFEEDRVGRHVYNAIGKRTFTISLHSPWYGPRDYSLLVRPADGIVDEAMKSLGSRFEPIGFDVVGSPFANIAPRDAVYRAGYDNFTLGKFCDGYICQKPFSEYEVVSYIDSFITESNLQYAQQQSPNPKFRNATVEEFEEAFKQQLYDWRQTYRGM